MEEGGAWEQQRPSPTLYPSFASQPRRSSNLQAPKLNPWALASREVLGVAEAREIKSQIFPVKKYKLIPSDFREFLKKPKTEPKFKGLTT